MSVFNCLSADDNVAVITLFFGATYLGLERSMGSEVDTFNSTNNVPNKAQKVEATA